ncbi:MFS transporter [Dictyobacter alpinus]|uniref:MFS transporter n=2 Tax=Dictyobacter alpinus TaxID=2014873 RepID=A0A402BC30_9CHLR|nr:MFS transporter [Dictyobacter alpinus]
MNPRILLLALGMFALGTDAFIVAGVLPVIAQDTGVSEGLVGQLITVFSLTYGLGAPVLAALSGRWAPNRVLIGASGLLCLANLASALAPSFPILLLTRILAGCFAATYTPLAFAAGMSLAPPARRGQALALVVSGLNIATVLGAPLGTWIGERLGWRLSFAMVALLAGIASLCLLLCGLPRSAPPSPLSLQERLRPIAQPRVMLVLLPALLWNIGVYSMYAYVAPFIQQQLQIRDVSLLLACFGLGIVCANRLSSLLADRFNPQRLIIVFLAMLIVLQLLLPLVVTTFVGGAIMFILWGMSFALLFIPQQQRLLNIAPEHANVILALNNSALYLGIAGGAAVGGLALRAFAITQLAWIGIVPLLTALLIVAFYQRRLSTC